MPLFERASHTLTAERPVQRPQLRKWRRIDGQIDQPTISMDRASDRIPLHIADLKFIGFSVGGEAQYAHRLPKLGDDVIHRHPEMQW